MRLLPACIASVLMLAMATTSLWAQEQEAEVTQEEQQRVQQSLDKLFEDIKNANALAQQVEQTALALQQLGRQLEKLEKLENIVLGSDSAERQQLLEAAERFAVATKQHLEATSAQLKDRNQYRDLERAYILSPQQLVDLGVVTRDARELPSLLPLLSEARSKSKFVTESDMQAEQARLEQARAELAAVQSAEMAARASELAAKTQHDLMAAELQKARLLNKVREVQLQAIEKYQPNLLPQSGEAGSRVEYQAAPDNVAGRMEALEQRLQKIEALLQKLTEGK